MIKFDSEFFNIEDTLYCGQVFRFKQTDGGFLVFSDDKCCLLRQDGNNTIIETDDEEYFSRYFDLENDYSKIVEKVKSFKIDFLTKAADKGKGIRILVQQPYEALVSFIVSQNNNIPRIKSTIEKLCAFCGKLIKFNDTCDFAFPKRESLMQKDLDFFKSVGLGYRAEYFIDTIPLLTDNFIKNLACLDSKNLLAKLVTLKGVGVKVASCAMLFGFARRNSFPVDTWIEKLYREDFCGSLNSRTDITKYFEDRFGEYSGYVQQYLFYAKRGK